jgi:5'-nucleotidase
MPQSTLTFITESIADSTVGVPVNFQLQASGGTPPYSFKITQGKLPKALKLSKDGIISGTPRAVADETVFIQLTDRARATLTQAFPVRVNAA